MSGPGPNSRSVPIEVKSDCQHCGGKHFVEVMRLRDEAGWLLILRRCRNCDSRMWIRQVKLSEVAEVRLMHRSGTGFQ